ncbi:MAG: glycosyltransferase family 39 protein [Proteobacteria bacterium]|nr:glycosyltransferase family 39 protein [Pseudomonadota bacterium]
MKLAQAGPRGIPAAGWVAGIVCAWVLFGLVGHDPWKPDEAHYFGVVVDLLHSHDWVVPTLAGEPWMEKPPLLYIVAGMFAHLAGPMLHLYDAARLATGFFVGVALVFLALTARELYGRGYGSAAMLVTIGCIGPIARMHQLITDVPLLTGISIGMYGLALARRTAWPAGLALGVGAACAFLAKGLIGPGWLGVTALALPVFAPWRTRRYAATLAIAGVVGAIPAVIWMGDLYARSPELFRTWLIANNFGRFFGFVRLGTRNPDGFYELTLLWYALPALPLAAWTLWQAWRARTAAGAWDGLVLPVVFAVVILGVLALASDSRDVYMMPIVLPLSLLAARALADLPAAGTRALSLSARYALGGVALILWLAWFALVTDFPSALHSALVGYQPGFHAHVHPLRLALALAATAFALRIVARPAHEGGSALTQWAVAVTLCWALISTLWTPFLNAGKSYRWMIDSLARELPRSGCVASRHLGEPQRALLEYFANVRTVRLEVHPDASCPALLVQGWQRDPPQAPGTGWTLAWEGARAGDRAEIYRLFRRDLPPDTVPVRFPKAYFAR